MMLKKNYFLLILFLIFSWVIAVPYHSAHAMTPTELRTKYNNALKTGNKVNVLIVPGHDDDYWGTNFGDIREADITVSIGQYLYDYLKNDPRLNVTISRTQTGYTDIFKNYFETNKISIENFISASRLAQQQKIASGEIQTTQSVPHNTALPEVALRLYGINKWANENNVDITLHIHINDEGGRSSDAIGDYTGFAIYIPENQYSNAGASAVVGESLYNELVLKNHVSTYPAESRGLIEDQDLIAIGASDTVKNAAALIEYGYIYEPQFTDIDKRPQVTKELAKETFLGIHRFFGDRDNFIITALTKDLKKGSSGSEVLTLQKMLTQSGVYSCGLTSTFGPCTETGVKAFQKRYGISQTGTIGLITRTKLNDLFAEK